IRRIGDAEGNITQVEQNVHGIQQTVSDPVNGLVTQVSTLASGFNVLAKDFEDMEIGGRNLIDSELIESNKGTIDKSGYATNGTVIIDTGTGSYTGVRINA